MTVTMKGTAIGKIAPRETEPLDGHPMALTEPGMVEGARVDPRPEVEDLSGDLLADHLVEVVARPVEAHLEVAELESVVQEMTRLDCAL